jgi:DNA-binding SARP family transcriptional activator
MHLLCLYGLPRVSIDGDAPLTLSAREAALLDWLHLEGPTPRAVLAGRLWPQGDEAKARANLRQTLARLRRAAGALIVEADGVLALAPDVTVAADGDARLLGPLEFDDAPELAEWLAARREAQQRDQQRERSAAAREHLAQGCLDAALAAADALLARDPAIEEAHRLRMEAHYLRGDRAAAITAWDECRLALRAAFGIAPSAPTQELGELILASAATPTSVPAARTLPAALRRPPQLVGRKATLEAIGQAFALGRGVVVAGPGGIGKSRLMADAAARMEPAITIRARPGDAVQPGAVASRLVSAAIERFDPDLDGTTREDIARLLPTDNSTHQALSSALEHRRVLASVARTMLACHTKGMRLVVVDDLQFADDESLAAIQIVVGGWLADPPASAALPMFGARAEELSPAGVALIEMMDKSGRSARFDLAPLTTGDVRHLVDLLPLAETLDRDALTQALHARVGGNPAFVLESLKALWLEGLDAWRPGLLLPVPPTLIGSVRQRLARLTEDALNLAQLAAVAHNEFSLALAASAFGREPMKLAPVLSELGEAQVFDGMHFGHDLMAEAVERSLPGALRAPLHRLVAEHLMARAENSPAAVAFHLRAAGDAKAAASWFLRAAQRAKDRWQLAEAAASFEDALSIIEPDRERKLFVDTAREAARCWLFLGRKDAAARLLDLAEPLARHAAERARLATLRTIALLNQQRQDEAAACAVRLADDLRLANEQLDAEALTGALRAVALALAMAGRGDEALSLLEQLGPAVDASQPRQQAILQQTRGALLCRLGRWTHAVPALQVALVAARQAGDTVTQTNASEELMRALIAIGQPRRALPVAEQALALLLDHGFGATFVADLRTQIALVLAALGRPAEALAQREAALQALQRSNAPFVDGLVNTHRVLLAACGQIAVARALPPRAHAAPSAGADVWGQFHARSMAYLALVEGHDPRPWFDTAIALGHDRLVLEVGRAAHEPPVSTATAEDWLQQAQARGVAGLAGMARLQLARACLAAGDRADAVAHAREALASEDAIEIWAEPAALRWLAAAEVLQTAGQDDAAQAALRAGSEWVRQAAAGLDPDARRAWCEDHALHRRLLQVAQTDR